MRSPGRRAASSSERRSASEPMRRSRAARLRHLECRSGQVKSDAVTTRRDFIETGRARPRRPRRRLRDWPARRRARPRRCRHRGLSRRPPAAHLPLLLGDDQSRRTGWRATAGRARPSPAWPRSASRSPPIRSASQRRFVDRARDAAARTLATLRFLANAPQGDAPRGMTGHKGFFYHFVDMARGARFERTELSTVDTALLLGGILFCQRLFRPARRSWRSASWPIASTRASTGAGRRRGRTGSRSAGIRRAASCPMTGSRAARRCWSTSWRSARRSTRWSRRAGGLVRGPARAAGAGNSARTIIRYRADVLAPIWPCLGRFPRHPGRLHARQGHRLFREQPPRDAGAGGLCAGQSDGLARLRPRPLGPHRLRRARPT